MKVLDVNCTFQAEFWGEDGHICLAWGHVPKVELINWMHRNGYDYNQPSEDEIAYRHAFVEPSPTDPDQTILNFCFNTHPLARPCTAYVEWA